MTQQELETKAKKLFQDEDFVKRFSASTSTGGDSGTLFRERD